MPQDSQVSNVETVSGLGGLVHDVFANEVKNHARVNSPHSQLYQDANEREDYRLEGSNLVGAAQLRRPGNAMGTGGNLPDHMYQAPTNWKITAARRYLRRAVDNFVQARGTGPGAFDDFISDVFDQQWEAWTMMEARHAVSDSNGYLCLCATRTSQTVITVDSGYGHTGTDPLLWIDEGITLAWLDASDSFNVGGAAVVSSIDYTTDEITFATNFDDGATLIADGDPIVTATTASTSADYFGTEYQFAPHGALAIVDPDENNTTVFNIPEGTYPRWKPYREASSTFDHIEVTEHWRKLASKGQTPVNAQTHTAVAQGAVVAELARTLVAFQQQTQLGRTFEGGYQAVRIRGMDIVEDDYFLHDVLMTYCLEDLFRADLDGEADYFAEDGSMYSRLADFDGKEWFVREYMQTWSDRRNRHGALTGITLANVDASDFSPVPNY